MLPKVSARVFWADDNPGDRGLIQLVLHELGLQDQVRLFKDGASLLEAARSDRPDFVVLDLRKPKLDGIETLARLRRMEGNLFLPAVFYSSWPSDRKRVAQFAVAEYVPKPLDLEDVRRSIARILGVAWDYR
ncbi:MAG TPA: response regulator [Candidatus Thermoplasmatota archaeon]|nr:response regulator [Candidatus Thermoplasmatota archaeon]